jgi:serine/threonine protein kinase
MTTAADPRVGADLGNYHIEAVVGRGGMGVVYRAEQVGLARKVALKVLAPTLVDDEAFRARFVRESQMAAAIDHPNILPIYEAGQAEGVYFLAMRFVDGTDLESRLRAGALEPRDTIRILAQVASALDAASEAGLVHRDVKPANILIASSKGVEKADHAYLTDFGLTKHRGSQTGLTQSGAFMGTLDYIAPEQVEGRPVDGRTDQYSLACVAFHCLTGTTPFPRDTDIAIAMAHLREQPPSATSLRPELPPDVDRVLARALAKKQDDRYPSSEGFVGALRQALGVRVSEPHPVPPATTSNRLPLLIGLLAVVAVVAVGGIGLLVSRAGQASPSTSAAELPSTSVTGSAPLEPTGDPFPTLLESSLILSLPNESGPECDRGDDALLPTRQGPSVRPRAHVVCSLVGGQGLETIEIWLLPFMADIRGSDVIVALATAAGVAEGDCATTDKGGGGWYAPETDLYGGHACWPSGDGTGSELAWSVDEAWVVYRARLNGRDHAALHAWWIANRESIVP